MTFEEYVLARGAALVRFARLLTGENHRAEDLAQDVLAKAFVNWRRVMRADNPDLYVRRMLINAHHSWWRRRTNREVPVAVPQEIASAILFLASSDAAYTTGQEFLVDGGVVSLGSMPASAEAPG